MTLNHCRLNNTTLLLLLASIIICSLFVFFSPGNSDEGYYIHAAQSINEGEILYTQFIYHQTPLYPYTITIFSSFGFSSYIFIRFFSLFLTLLLFITIYVHVRKTTQSVAASNFALTLLILNGTFLTYVILVKTYALVNLLFYSAFFCSVYVRYNFKIKDTLLVFLTGVFSGLSVSTRFIFIVPSLVILIFIIMQVSRSKESKKLTLFVYPTILVAGFMLASLPTFYFLLYHTDDFLFGVITCNIFGRQYHWLNGGTNLMLWLKFFLQPQIVILLAQTLFGLKYIKTNRYYYLIITISFILIHIPLFPVNEYLTVLVPYMVFIGALSYQQLTEKLKPLKLRILLAAYIVSIFVGVPHFKHLLTGDTLEPGPAKLKEIIGYENSIKGKYILSCWDIYAVLSNKQNLFNNEYVYSYMAPYLKRI